MDNRRWIQRAANSYHQGLGYRDLDKQDQGTIVYHIYNEHFYYNPHATGSTLVEAPIALKSSSSCSLVALPLER